MMILLLTVTSLGLMTAAVAAYHGRSAWPWLVYGALLGFIALPHALLLRRLPEAGDPGFAGFGLPVGNRQCFHCDRTISADAVVCQYCQRPLYGSRARDDEEDEPASPEAARADAAGAGATAPWAADSFARIVAGERRSAHSADARSMRAGRDDPRGPASHSANAPTTGTSSAAPTDEAPAARAAGTASTPGAARKSSDAEPATLPPTPAVASSPAKAEAIFVGPPPAAPALADASTFPSVGDEPRFVASVVTDSVVRKATITALPDLQRHRVVAPDPTPSLHPAASVEAAPPPASRTADVEARPLPAEDRRTSLTFRATPLMARAARPLLVDATQNDHSASGSPAPRGAPTEAASVPDLHGLRAKRDDRLTPSAVAPVSAIPAPTAQRSGSTATTKTGTPGILLPRAAVSLPAWMSRQVLSPYGGHLAWTGGAAAVALCIVAAGFVWYGQPRPAAEGVAVSVERAPAAPASAMVAQVAARETAVVPTPPEIPAPDWQRQAHTAAESLPPANSTSDRQRPANTMSADATSGEASSVNAAPVDNVDSRMVASIQRELNALGYQAGPVDGVFGPRTRDAVRRFEDRIGMSVDGVIDAPLLDALGIRVASRAAAN